MTVVVKNISTFPVNSGGLWDEGAGGLPLVVQPGLDQVGYNLVKNTSPVQSVCGLSDEGVGGLPALAKNKSGGIMGRGCRGVACAGQKPEWCNYGTRVQRVCLWWTTKGSLTPES